MKRFWELEDPPPIWSLVKDGHISENLTNSSKKALSVNFSKLLLYQILSGLKGIYRKTFKQREVYFGDTKQKTVSEGGRQSGAKPHF